MGPSNNRGKRVPDPQNEHAPLDPNTERERKPFAPTKLQWVVALVLPPLVAVGIAIWQKGDAQPAVGNFVDRNDATGYVSDGPTPPAVEVQIEADAAVANVTRGDTEYQDVIDAAEGDIVKFQFWYYNRENVDSGRYANDLTIKVHPTETLSREQVIRAEVFGSNTNAVEVRTTVNVPERGLVVELQPGTATWRHNSAPENDSPAWETVDISDELYRAGVQLEDAGPCIYCEATVTVLGKIVQQ